MTDKEDVDTVFEGFSDEKAQRRSFSFFGRKTEKNNKYIEVQRKTYGSRFNTLYGTVLIELKPIQVLSLRVKWMLV